ncbi:MAG TPA: DNA-primase RepB domain-containing protein [Terriglobales bacterium]|nr:DNA-primase RepB domain-containing protein [Terriglobales bacterium]
MTTTNEISTGYIRNNFEAADRIAIVLLNKRSGVVLQRVVSAERVVAPEYQAWLRHMNAQKYEVYISMNTLKEGTHRRTKDDVDQIRHVYLDFDENGTQAVEALLERTDLPEPNYLINSSPDKWQVIWKIAGCSKEQAGEIERGLVGDTGADPAVVDVARVLRLPGFYNHKYSRPHLVVVESRSDEISGPEEFPRLRSDSAARDTKSIESERARLSSGKITQSERDWARVRRELREGASPEALIEDLRIQRADKFNPKDYARRTVEKAVASLRGSNASGPER